MQQIFQDKVVIVTGGANGIGKCIADEFRKQGACVYVIDRQEGDHFVGDISKKEVLEAFVTEVLKKHDRIDCIINNALPLMKGIDECSYEEFQYALSVGVTAPFYLVKLLMNHLAEGASIVNICNIGSPMAFIFLFIAFLVPAESAGLFIGIAVALYSLATLFQLVTLPVEFDASKRAMASLEATGLYAEDELRGASKVLRAAALTYVAALATSVIQLLRLISRVSNRRR